MKQFVKALDKDGSRFAFISRKISGLSTDKLEAGILDVPQITVLLKDPDFVYLMTEVERRAWTSFTLIVKNFLDIHKADNYAELVNNMLEDFKELGYNMSIKVHYLHSHLGRFPENLGDKSEEQGERFYQQWRTFTTEDGIYT